MPIPPRALIDLNSFLAVESLFRGGATDPWGRFLAGQLADAVVYSVSIRFPLPLPNLDTIPDVTAVVPSIVSDLMCRNSNLFTPIIYSTDEQRVLKVDYTLAAFEKFLRWGRTNSPALSRWSDLHAKHWVTAVANRELAHPYVFSMEPLQRYPNLAGALKALGLSLHAACYAFDSVLRFPMYGEMAAADEHYLNHPVRDAFGVPTSTYEPGPAPAVPFSFRPLISELVPHLSQDEFCVLLHTLRAAVWERGLHDAERGKYAADVIREVLAEAAIPAHLRRGAAVLGVLGGLAAAAGTLPLGPVVPLLGAAISIASAIWSKIPLPRVASRVRWLRWALEWPGEEQADERQI